MNKVISTELEINDWFDQLEEDIDLYITDPPYPFNNKNGSNRFAFVDGEDEMYDRLEWEDLGEVFKKMYETSAVGGRAYVFCNRDGYEKTKKLLVKAGWTFRNKLVWDKINFGGGYHWRNVTEYIVYVTKDRPKVYVKGHSNEFSYKKPGKGAAMPKINYDPSSCDSPKPFEIWRDIILHGGADDDVCADPFAGSNPMRVALLTNQDLMDKIKKAYTNVY